jgi:hypothetical protein
VLETNILPLTVEQKEIYKHKRWFQVGIEQKRLFLMRRSYSSYVRENYNIAIGGLQHNNVWWSKIDPDFFHYSECPSLCTVCIML